MKQAHVLVACCLFYLQLTSKPHCMSWEQFHISKERGWHALQVCAQAGIKPSQVAYVEAHGTGTVVGDGQELSALEEFYAIKVSAEFFMS